MYGIYLNIHPSVNNKYVMIHQKNVQLISKNTPSPPEARYYMGETQVSQFR